jgi:hypothetical protein
MIQDKLKQLSEMKRELSIEEKMLNYYTKHAPEGKVTFTMQVADEINRQTYEKKCTGQRILDTKSQKLDVKKLNK